ncbi:unnamed protein product [Citrullus colocynthis]|uniref:RING-type domain-containing protein n=1 Tax=Citrullus colocynthis TaxID=252529 RepID=A0ABP0XSS9_9ROSI
MEGGRRRITLYDQMLAVSDGRELAGGFTLNDVLTIQKRASPTPSPAVRLNGRTLLDIIRDDVGKSPVGNRERKSWKFLKDRLRLNLRSQIPPPNSFRFPGFSSAEMTPNEEQSTESTTTRAVSAAPSLRQISRRNSTRLVPPSSEATNSDDSPDNNNSATTAAVGGGRSLLRPQMSRHNSTRISIERSESFTDLTEPAREGTRRLSAALAEERSMSAREAVAAQEAADAEATANEAEQEEEEEEEDPESAPAPVRMSLMDLLEETDRQMGFEGSRYRIEDEEEEEEEEEEESDDEVTAVCGGGGTERNCCVCMVRHKGAAFIPCGHTFCRLCSRELWVSRGNCPLCNGFILEILDIF